MNVPTLGRIKDVIKDKGYGDLFTVNTSSLMNHVTGEIPIDFLYFILNTPGAIEVINKVFKEENYSPSPVIDGLKSSELIKKMLTALIDAGISTEEEQNANNVTARTVKSLSKLVFIGIRSKEFGGWFDDLLIVANRDGSIFNVFKAHTDLDYHKVHSAPVFKEDVPFVIKPGFYKNLFCCTYDANGNINGVIQNEPIDLYALTFDNNHVPVYQQVMRGNYQLSIGCVEGQSSDSVVTKQMFAAELANHSECNKLIADLKQYMDNDCLDDEAVINDNGRLCLIEPGSNMKSFHYLLLTENDFEVKR